jgi:hypothetical protein
MRVATIGLLILVGFIFGYVLGEDGIAKRACTAAVDKSYCESSLLFAGPWS